MHRERAPRAQRRRLRRLLERPGPFPPTTAGDDFEGFPLFEAFGPGRVRTLTVAGKDLSRADARDAWIERGRFVDCAFAEADFREALIKRTRFEGCTFLRAQFAGTSFHYTATFAGCRFEHCTFTGGLRLMLGRFQDTHFVDCRFTNVDFGGSSFERCSFSGRLREVQFRAADPRDSFLPARWRQRFDVDFSDADVDHLNFDNGLDLSSVRLPHGWVVVPAADHLLAELRSELTPAHVDELAEILDVARQPQQALSHESLRALAPAIADDVWRAIEGGRGRTPRP